MTSTGGASAGSRIGPFHLDQLLGEGGQGTVWKARDVRDRRVVALKVIRRSLAGPSEMARLRREEAILRSFEHPGLPRGFELFEDEAAGVLALAMEYVEAPPLQRLLADRRLAPREVAKLGLGIARVLAVIHAQGIAHRDLKPSNILVRPSWSSVAPDGVVIVDFGIARGQEQHATTYTAVGGAVGTLSFMAPERLMARASELPTSPSLDVYALGVLLWSILTGHHPTGLTMTASISELVMAYANPRAPAIDPRIAASIDATLPGLLPLLAQCLSLKPDDRPKSEAIKDELEALLARAGETVLPAAPAPRATWTSAVPPADAYTGFTPERGWTQHAGASRPVDPSRAQPTQLVQRPQRSSWFAPALAAVALLFGSCALAVVVVSQGSSGSSSASSGGSSSASSSGTPWEPPSPRRWTATPSATVSPPVRPLAPTPQCFRARTKFIVGEQCVSQPCKGGLHAIWNCAEQKPYRVRCDNGVVVADRCDTECITIVGGKDDQCE